MQQWKGATEWEEISRCGGGGQSDVFLVRNSQRIAERKKHLAKLMELSGQGFNEVRAQQFVEATLGYGREERTSELGALKVYKPRPVGTAAEQQALERLNVEIAVLGQNRRGLPRLLDSNESGRWIVTEFYSRGTLENNLLRYKGNPLRSLATFRQLVETVAAFHKEGIVHRDIKPANVFIDADGNGIVGDFGIAFLPDRPERLTFTNESVGPRDYMPPWADTEERFENVTATFDIYMLGKLLWCMVAGRLKLIREWYTRPEFDLTVKFPGDPQMHMINAILEKCLHEAPEKCLSQASELLLVVDGHLSAMRRGGQMLEDGVPRPCHVCGKGFYQPFGGARGEGEVLALHSGSLPYSAGFGFRQEGVFHVRYLVCDCCKNVGLFRVP
jgi:serine/threonine protein kinase